MCDLIHIHNSHNVPKVSSKINNLKIRVPYEKLMEVDIFHLMETFCNICFMLIYKY